MTEQELQIAVCKELGWKLESYKEEESGADIPIWRNPHGMYVRHNPPPLTLDLMHEAEKTLSRDEYEDYLRELGCWFNDSGISGQREQYSAPVKDRATTFIAVKQKGI